MMNDAGRWEGQSSTCLARILPRRAREWKPDRYSHAYEYGVWSDSDSTVDRWSLFLEAVCEILQCGPLHESQKNNIRI